MAARGGYKGGTKRRHSERARRPYSRVFYFLDKIPAYVHKIHLRGKWSAHAGKYAAAPVLVVSAIPFRTRQAPRKAVLFTYTIKSLCRFLKCRYGANTGFLHRDFFNLYFIVAQTHSFVIACFRRFHIERPDQWFNSDNKITVQKQTSIFHRDFIIPERRFLLPDPVLLHGGKNFIRLRNQEPV